MSRYKRKARARVSVIPKDGGGTRSITSFDWVDRARQLALKAAFTPFANLHDDQFMLARDAGRRGPAAVRKALLAALNECGEDTLFVQFDVRDFYGSISHEWLEGHLGIDPVIVRRQIHSGEMLIVPTGKAMVVRGPHEAIATEKVRRGIPQGSALSALVGEMVMAEVLRGVAVLADLPTFIWSDNVGVLVPSHQASEVMSLVRVAFARHGAGPFDLTESVKPASREFKFLGVWYRRNAQGAEAFVPSEVANAWAIKVGQHISVASAIELDAMERHVRSKMNAWRWWSGAASLEREVANLIASAREAPLAWRRTEPGTQ